MRHERHRLASRAGAARAADSVHVVLGHVRHVVIDHVRQLLDVEPSGRNIRRYEHAKFAVLEALQGARARVLALVAVDGVGLDAVALELLGEPVGAALGLAEHQHLAPVARPHEMREQVALAILRHRVRALRHQLGGRIAARDFHGRRVAQESAGELPHLVGKSRREEQVLALRRQQREDAADVGDEAHVEHAIGLVEHQDLDAPQVQGLLPRVVEQAPRRRHQDVDAAAQRVDLRLHADAAEDHGGTQCKVPAVGAHILVDLRRELARRGDDQRADGMARRRMAVVCARGEALQHRQREPGGLAGAGLRGAEQVAAAQYDRNRLRLNGGGPRVALLGDRAQQLGAQAEGVERRSNGVLLKSAWEEKLPTGSGRCCSRQGDSRSGMDRETTETLTGRRAAETYRHILSRIMPRAGAARR